MGLPPATNFALPLGSALVLLAIGVAAFVFTLFGWSV